MPLFELNLPPGVRNNGTADQAEMRWESASLVRWANGEMAPIGGFKQDAVFQGTTNPARKAISWLANNGTKWIAYADDLDVYADTVGGAGPFNITPTDLYSSPNTRPTNSQYQVYWSMHNWGENLVMCNNYDGRIYEWVPNATTPGTAKRITTANGYTESAPTNCTSVFVTEERFLFALGAGGDKRNVQWSDREDLGVWAPTSENEAGDFLLSGSGEIQCGVSFAGKTLLLTTTDAYAANYLGPPFVYGFERVGDDCGIISQNAAVATDVGVFWMGQSNIYLFDGANVRTVPCEVRDSVFNDFYDSNVEYRKAIWAFHHAQFNEVWWFYPRSNGQDSYDNGSYVVYNYAENTWMLGGEDVPGATSTTPFSLGQSRLNRTCGIGSDVVGRIVWWSSIAFEHEIPDEVYVPVPGVPTITRTSFAMSAPFQVSPTQDVATLTQVRQDIENSSGAKIWAYKKLYPNSTETRSPSSGQYTLDNPTDVRITGRYFRLVVQFLPGQGMKAGKFTFEWQPRGKR